MAKQKKIDLEHMTEKEKMKYEIADELGLLDRVLNDGWRSLTAKERKDRKRGNRYSLTESSKSSTSIARSNQ